ncbi:hypothetical protein EFN64_10140 [Leuconostoc citreum]|nr:hypothetical protein [Leuconostoc citreum]HCM90429.1 hypothetical protein [Vagococcus sp.]MCT3059483.1 hypothetical protein [Leuconostoc citreum]MCT3060419.1 hypothetical protein [Leuconostoc citreum]MCT3072045.1 hypothetical protein [Leuconostoc citreum]
MENAITTEYDYSKEKRVLVQKLAGTNVLFLPKSKIQFLLKLRINLLVFFHLIMSKVTNQKYTTNVSQILFN